MSTKIADLLMVEGHHMWIFSDGGVVCEKTWNFSAINISKAILKMKVENAPASPMFGETGIAIDYFDVNTLQWRELGAALASRWFGGDAYNEVDITSICRASPYFRWRARIASPFFIYYSCMKYTAYLRLEYTPISGEPEATGSSITSLFGNEALAPLAEGFNLMINIMFIMMITSLMMSIITSIIGGE